MTSFFGKKSIRSSRRQKLINDFPSKKYELLQDAI